MGTEDDNARQLNNLQAELSTVYAALEGIQHRLAEMAPAPRPDGPSGAKGPTGPRAAEPPPDGPIGPTGPRRMAAPPPTFPDGTTGPTGPTRPRRAGTAVGEQGLWSEGDNHAQLVLPTGTPVQLGAGTRWVWIDGVLVVF